MMPGASLLEGRQRNGRVRDDLGQWLRRALIFGLCGASAAVSGCLDLTGRKPPPKVQPIALSYPYEVEDSLRFKGYRELAHAVSLSYVRVVIRDESRDDARSVSRESIVNAASGAIVDARGLVVTAAHIAIDERFEAEVITTDGRHHEARILAVDPARELAILRILPFPGIRSAVLGNSDRIEKDEHVIAIGTPENKGGVVSLGRVVDPKRTTRLEYNGYGFNDGVKLNIYIEPGHSGGPVFNERGEMIGLVATFVLGDISAADYQSPRLAYAVPSNAIRAYLRAIGAQ